MPTHPCLRCGACCAHFRVGFHWSQAQPHDPQGPPPALTVPLRRHELAMRGTEGARPRCVALVGVVGEAAHCGQYANRPSPCRELAPAWESGQPSPQCDRARAAHGLAPLSPADWLPAQLPVVAPAGLPAVLPMDLPVAAGFPPGVEPATMGGVFHGPGASDRGPSGGLHG